MNELEIRKEIQEEHASPLDTQPTPQEQKCCKHCGQRIAKDAVICVHCGRQVEELGTKGKDQYEHEYGPCGCWRAEKREEQMGRAVVVPVPGDCGRAQIL